MKKTSPYRLVLALCLLLSVNSCVTWRTPAYSKVRRYYKRHPQQPLATDSAKTLKFRAAKKI